MKRIFLVGLLAAALGSFIWLLLLPDEPVYKGKPLSFWLQGYDPGNYNVARPKGPYPPNGWEANEAIRQIGTNAIPALLRMIQLKDSEFKITIMKLLRNQHFIKSPFTLENRNRRAFDAFFALGSGASNAVPRLIEIFDSDPYPFPQQAIPLVFGNIGTAAAPAIPALLRGITHTNESVRNNAIYALGQIHTDPTLVVPALIKCLKDPDAAVRAQVAHSLGKFGKDAQSSVLALLELLHNEVLSRSNSSSEYIVTYVGSSWRYHEIFSSDGPYLPSVIEDALQSIDLDALAKAGVK